MESTVTLKQFEERSETADVQLSSEFVVRISDPLT